MPSLRRPHPDPRLLLSGLLVAVSLLVGKTLVAKVVAAPAKPARAEASGLHLRSTKVLATNDFQPLLAFSRDGATLWLARFEDGRLWLTARDAEGAVSRETTVPVLALRQPPTGMIATATGMIVYGDTPVEGGWRAYVQFFDEQGKPGKRRDYLGALAIRSAVASSDGSLTLLMHASDKVEIHGVKVAGPSSSRRDLPTAVVVRLDASGAFAWLRTLDDATVARDPWIVGSDDGQLALLLGQRGVLWGADGPSRHGGAALRWSREGETTWTAEGLSAVDAAAFDSHGTLWALGRGTLAGAPTKILPARKVPQVLDAYRPTLDREGRRGGPKPSRDASKSAKLTGAARDRRRLCAEGCLGKASLAIDDEGGVVLLAAVTRPCRIDDVALPVDGVLAESWSLLRLDHGRLRARHTLTTTHVRLAVAGTGRVALVATGVRGGTTLDHRTLGDKGETVLLQFDR